MPIRLPSVTLTQPQGSNQEGRQGPGQVRARQEPCRQRPRGSVRKQDRASWKGPHEARGHGQAQREC